MITVPVDLGARAYDVIVGPGAREWLATVLPPTAKRAAIVTQETVEARVEPGVEAETFVIGDGEEAKTLQTVEDLCRAWSRWGRSSSRSSSRHAWPRTFTRAA